MKLILSVDSIAIAIVSPFSTNIANLEIEIIQEYILIAVPCLTVNYKSFVQNHNTLIICWFCK